MSIEASATVVEWTPQERESFFAAIARHRRAAWQVGLISSLCLAVLAFVLALLTAPLWYALLGLVLDLANLLVTAPNLIDTVMTTLGTVTDEPQHVSAQRWIYLTVIAALPGMLVAFVVLQVLGRIVREAETAAAVATDARAPAPDSFEERRIANVVAEMSLAANVTPPTVLIVPSESANATAFGADERSATVLVTSGLLQTLSRAQQQAVVAHLIGHIANGDIPHGLRVARALSLFGFVARLSDGIVDPPAWRKLWALARGALRRGSSSHDGQLILELTNPFGGEQRQGSSNTSNQLTWREWVRMPLFGPLVLGGFFGGLVSSVVLEPLIALAWRRRKYMADAIALQLTRDADAMAGALNRLATVANSGALPAWSAHLAVLQSTARRGLLSGSPVPMFPSLERRLKALGRMGSNVQLRVRTVPPWAWLIGVPLFFLIAGLLAVAIYLLVLVSVALSGLFTWLPAILLHALLR